MAQNKLLSTLVFDGLASHELRHIERDIFVHPNEPMPSNLTHDRVYSADPSQIFTLLWPKFEIRHADPIMYTLMPMALERMRGLLPLRFGVSGWKYAAGSLDALRRVNRTFCATERRGVGLARCKSSCYDQLQICGVLPREQRLGLYYAAMHDLDSTAYGLPYLASDTPALSSANAVLRVLLAVRVGRRFVQNMPELCAACEGTAMLGYTLACACVRLGQFTPQQLVERMRATDVAVFMCATAFCGPLQLQWHPEGPLRAATAHSTRAHEPPPRIRPCHARYRHGGDEINSVHMPPGRAVVEIVNCGFIAVNRNWLDQYRERLISGLRHFRLVARQPAGARQALDRNSGWNADATVPWPALRSALQTIIRTFAEHNLARRRGDVLGPALRRGAQWPMMDCTLDGRCDDATPHFWGNHSDLHYYQQCERACLAHPTGPRERGCERVNASQIQLIESRMR